MVSWNVQLQSSRLEKLLSIYEEARRSARHLGVLYLSEIEVEQQDDEAKDEKWETCQEETGAHVIRHDPGQGSRARCLICPPRTSRFVRSVKWHGRCGTVHLADTLSLRCQTGSDSVGLNSLRTNPIFDQSRNVAMHEKRWVRPFPYRLLWAMRRRPTLSLQTLVFRRF